MGHGNTRIISIWLVDTGWLVLAHELNWYHMSKDYLKLHVIVPLSIFAVVILKMHVHSFLFPFIPTFVLRVYCWIVELIVISK